MLVISVWKVEISYSTYRGSYLHTCTVYVEASSARVAEKRALIIVNKGNDYVSTHCTKCEHLGEVYLAKGL